ncbi:hypothetical protein C0J52_27768 [Blattella germanica]|nr:hypothetical protein C0J52_27768 [Blattella germanica]
MRRFRSKAVIKKNSNEALLYSKLNFFMLICTVRGKKIALLHFCKSYNPSIAHAQSQKPLFTALAPCGGSVLCLNHKMKAL